MALVAVLDKSSSPTRAQLEATERLPPDAAPCVRGCVPRGYAWRLQVQGRSIRASLAVGNRSAGSAGGAAPGRELSTAVVPPCDVPLHWAVRGGTSDAAREQRLSTVVTFPSL